MSSGQLILAGVLALFVLAGTVAAALILRALMPATAARLDDVVEQHGDGRRFLMGLFNGPALLLVSILLLKSEPGKLPGFLLLLGLMFLIVLGLVAELPAVAGGLPGAGEMGPVGRTLWAGALLSVVNLLPFLGQAIALFLLLRALGTGVFFLFTRPRPARPE
ncbi:MAG: hypothetical protein DIJKHBIC_03234 [Thermoanaerobaculia bacterium]|nr:hypothetical protein [Thermoanaerobaculia bacterium]